MIVVESENKNLNPKSNKSKYLMKKDKLRLIKLCNLDQLLSDYNIKESFLKVHTFFQFEPDGDFTVDKKIERTLGFYEQNKKITGIINVNNRYDDAKDNLLDVYSMKCVFRKGSENQNEDKQAGFKLENTVENSPLLEIVVKRNENNDIIVEKYDPDPSKCEFIKSKVKYITLKENDVGSELEEELMYETKNFQKQGDNYSYEVKILDINNINTMNLKKQFVKKSAKLPSGNILYNHIGKTILFLLSLVILGIVWYLNLVSSSILLVSLAVGFILFVTFAIWDQKKKIFPKPKKIWTDFRSRLGFGRSEQKENSNIPRTDNDINQSII